MDKTLKFWELESTGIDSEDRTTDSTSSEDLETGFTTVNTLWPVRSVAGIMSADLSNTCSQSVILESSDNWIPIQLIRNTHDGSSHHFDPKCLARYSALSLLLDNHILLYHRFDNLLEWSLEEIRGTTDATLIGMAGKQGFIVSYATLNLPRMSTHVPFRHGVPGFYCSFVELEEGGHSRIHCYIGIECWTLFSDPVKGSYLVKLARGRISEQLFPQCTHARDPSHSKLKPVHIVQLWDTPDPLDSSKLIGYIGLSSGEGYSFTWKPATQFDPLRGDEPQTLNFVSCAIDHYTEELFQIPPLFGSRVVHDIPFSKVVDSNGASWVLDEKGRKILWVPPVHDGQEGRWWQREKLLLVSEYSRLTILDFSNVNFDEERPF